MDYDKILEEVNHPELVFGLVGPIGVNMDDVQNSLHEALLQVGYDAACIHLTKSLQKYQAKVRDVSGQTEYEVKISTANSFCRAAEDGAAMAALAILEIKSARLDHNKEVRRLPDEQIDTAIPKRAYIIRQLKRKDEIKLLRRVYGDKFIQISISLPKELRVENLIKRMAVDHPHMKQSECERNARKLIEIDEDEDGDDYGQQVGEIFHLGDFFVRSDDIRSLNQNLQGFIRALFGDNRVSPTKDEFGAYMASTAALRSADLSRQVGSAILSDQGDIIAVGCNEVPKAGGGNYWYDDATPARDIERGGEQNSIEKQRIIVDFMQGLQKAGLVTGEMNIESDEMKRKLASVTSDALISDITEYGRMTHAEMSAICDAARLGRQVLNSTIFVTTFPCHNCAKHIVAAGIKRVVFIEPYPKSKALVSHTDSVTNEPSSAGKVVFEHFQGIAPSRYREIFSKGRRRKGAKVEAWYEGEARPRVLQRENFHIRREGVALDLLKSAFETEQGTNGDTENLANP